MKDEIFNPHFRALRVHAGADKRTEARFEDLTLDALSAGDVVVRVAFSGINYKDALAVTGKGRILKGYPKVPGIDLSGHVAHSLDPRYREGDPVLVTGCNLGEALDGGYAEYARVPGAILVPLPLGLSLREAMVIGTAGFTAALALRRMLENHQVPAMGPLAVTGPTGGVGSFAVDLFARAGFAVHAITGKPAQAAEYLRAIGATEVVDRKSVDMGDRPLESAHWGGAVDNLGGETLAWLLRSTRAWGNVASIGLAQSHELHATVMPFILRGVSLLGIHSVECPRAWREDIWHRLSADWKPRILDRVVAHEVGLDEVPAACEALIAGQMTGRVLVRIAV